MAAVEKVKVREWDGDVVGGSCGGSGGGRVGGGGCGGGAADPQICPSQLYQCKSVLSPFVCTTF